MKSPSKTKAKYSKQDIWEVQYDVEVAANIIKARMKKGWSQKKLAEKMGTVQPALARAESGDIPPSHPMLKRIARALGMKLEPPTFL